MSPKVVRALAMAVFFALGIPGMIVASINDNEGAAVTFGLITAAVAVVLIVVSAVTTSRLDPGSGVPTRAAGRGGGEQEAEALEARLQAMVARGSAEAELRDLVRAAMQVARRPPR